MRACRRRFDARGIAHSRSRRDGTVSRPALSDDDRDVDRGVHNVSRTAMIAAMIAIAAAGLPSFAMVVAPSA